MKVERATASGGVWPVSPCPGRQHRAGFSLQYVNRTVLSWLRPEALVAALPAGMLAWTFQGLFIVSCGYLGVFAVQHVAAGERSETGAMVSAWWPASSSSRCVSFSPLYSALNRRSSAAWRNCSAGTSPRLARWRQPRG